MKASSSVAALGLALALWTAPFAATAAPLCAGATSVSALGATGCEIGNVTFSGFSITNASVGVLTPPDGIDPANILVNITLGTLSTGFLQSIPAIEVRVRPSDPAFWSMSGVPFSQSLGFTLSYSVAIDSPLEEFDRYQVRGQGSSDLRSGPWSVVKSVTGGNALSVGFGDPFLFEFGTFGAGVTSFDVSDAMSVSGGLGSGSITEFTNAFSVRVIPEPGTALLVLGGLAAVAARRRC